MSHRNQPAADGVGDDLVSESFDALNVYADDDDGRAPLRHAQSPEYVSITSSPSSPRPRSTVQRSLPQIVVDLSQEGAPIPLSDAPDVEASPNRKHGRDTPQLQLPLRSAESSKRPKLDIEPPLASPKADVAVLLNPAPEDEAAGSSRSRILFKCAVCLDRPDPAVFVQACGHVFCEACAQGAVQSTMRCPVCRHSIHMRDIRVLQFRVAKVGRETV
ncbi:E3 ubiquitin-protein ligase rnf4 [Coemansia spiralis]|nr:E3 ubiquitin-protein ligase rnf4 [Coemansia spiralis]